MLRLIYEGKLLRRGMKILEAASSVTFIETGSHRIVVDTSSQDKRDRILKGLERLGLSPRDIDVVINTHSHWDHLGNNDLFKDAEIINYENYRSLKDREIEILETPGHTWDSISVIHGNYIVVGDAVPLRDNVVKEVAPGVNVNRELALKTLKMIKSLEKHIVTGHDGIFYNNKR
ncbi:MAG TPA: MBL fold metallo-hydrolase [Methanococcaceae archaeon]|uniref:Metallo-beta-lactamase domain-containing protein 1 n=1 Tax=Methanothermococcus okinawensis TaxID=155863 RepID=A0A832ZKR7_9EURY|nr:MBL fold metallo-hydrolase [Methanococcaceae archaeon]HIP91271.1 MBL fold metallo-hydrolase [Methanothermococcus okinawensis]